MAQLHEIVHVRYFRNRVLLHEEALQISAVLEAVERVQAVALEEDRLESRVLLEVLYLREALEVEVDLVVQGWRGVEIELLAPLPEPRLRHARGLHRHT